MIDQLGTIDPRVYDGLQAFTVQSFTEANVKNGTQFYITTSFDLATSGTTKEFVFRTGNKDTIVKSRAITTDGSMTYDVYRSSTTSGGTPLTIHNLNDRNPESPIIVVADSPTITDDGTFWDDVFSYEGQGNQPLVGIFQTEGAERVLAPNTEYLVRFTSNAQSSIKIGYKVSWYEGPLSSDI